MKIIVYGIGKYFREHEALLPKDAEIIAYGDGAVGKATSHTGGASEEKASCCLRR